jgi:hypothetical protein
MSATIGILLIEDQASSSQGVQLTDQLPVLAARTASPKTIPKAAPTTALVQIISAWAWLVAT